MACAAALSFIGTETTAQNFFTWPFGAPIQQENPQQGTRQQGKKVGFVYDADFNFNFDNREFDAGDEQFTESMTIFGARLTPSVGVQFRSHKNVTHRLMAGIDVMKDFGRSPSAVAGSSEADRGLENTRLFREITMYYGIDARYDNWRIRGYAGIFPRAFSEGEYSEAFFSDSLKFYDNNLEGFLVKAQGRKAYMELAFDWNGKYGSYRREQFSAFGYGKYDFTDWLRAGLAFKYHHYANAEEYGSVVDDALIQPFVRFGFERFCGMQDLSLTFSGYFASQQDRRIEDGKKDNSGAELTLSVRNWNVGIENRLYYGQSLMPFYDYVDDGGFKYGNNLYTGSPFYRASITEPGKWNLYDRLEVYYQPHIADFLDLRLSIVAHFPDGFKYAGMQQKASLIFCLDKVLHPQNKTAVRVSRSADRPGNGHRTKPQRPRQNGGGSDRIIISM